MSGKNRLQKAGPDADISCMRGLLKKLMVQDDGLGIASALAVAVVIFILGISWYSVSLHELEEVAYDRHLATAVNVAEAGAREMMYLLASNEGGTRDAADAGMATTGVTGTTCDLGTLETVVDGGAEVQGEYWVRAVPLAAARSYLIESWGWAPLHTTLQSVAKKVVIEVELVPIGGGFYYALFAAEGGLTAGNRKEIYGDAYSGKDLAIGNYTRVFPNDDGAPGTGQMLVYRDLLIGSGSNVEIAGEIKVNGFVRDDSGSKYGTAGNDLIILNDTTLSGLPKSTFKKNKASVGRTLQVAGPTTSVTDPPSASSYVYDATGIPPVPEIMLPKFVWNATTYTNQGMTATEYNTWGQFQTWYNANKGALTGAHHVKDTSAFTLDMGGATLTGDFVLAFKGDLELRGTPNGVSDPSLAPVTVVLAGTESDSDVTLANSSNSIKDQVHHLIYAGGTFGASQQTTIYGAMYGDKDASSNRLEIHFRPPSTASVAGFTFDPALADSFIPRPGTWREIPADAMGCTLP
jgi:hypothetical protein